MLNLPRRCRAIHRYRRPACYSDAHVFQSLWNGGARVGYAFGATELITSFEKIRNHFGMNRAAQMAAIAALQDVDWLRKTIADVETSRQAISQIAADNGLVACPLRRTLSQLTVVVTGITRGAFWAVWLRRAFLYACPSSHPRTAAFASARARTRLRICRSRMPKRCRRLGACNHMRGCVNCACSVGILFAIKPA